MKENPIYTIRHFQAPILRNDLYVSTFKNHLTTHSFIEKPHRHTFYLLVFFTAGSGMHEIDFTLYPIKPGSLFVLQPGQMHHWELSQDVEGYIVFYSQEWYNLYFGTKNIEDYPFYQSVRNTPEVFFELAERHLLLPYFELMTREHQDNAALLLNLLDCIHIEVARKYLLENNHTAHAYNHKLHQFETILEEYYRNEKSPSFYASKMNMTLKHLNRICKTILGKTVTELITNRLILEAKRLLINPSKSITQVADQLGFENYSYFTKLFKKHTGITPGEFRNGQK